MPLSNPENLRALLSLEVACDTAPYGLMVADRELIVRYVNQTVSRLINLPLDQILNNPVSVASPGTQEAVAAILHGVLKTGNPAEATEFPATVAGREPEGTLYWNGTFSPIRTPAGEVVGVLCHFVETTAQVRARQEQAARTSELDIIFNAITDGLAITDAQGNVVRMNAAGERIMRGGTPIRRPLAEVTQGVSPRNPLTGAPLAYEALATTRALRGETVLGHEQLVRDGLGTDIVLSVNAAPLRDPATGQSAGAITMFRDITHIKQLQAETAAAYARSRRIAQTLQESLLPEMPLRFDSHTMGLAFEPAWIEEADVGGDLVDFFVTGNADTQRAHMMVADVSGKGLMAARRTALIKYTVKALAGAGLGPQAVMGQLNDTLTQDAGFDGFVTLFYGVFALSGQRLTYISAGHEPGLLWQSETRKMRLLSPTGLPLGVLSRDEGARWGVKHTRLRPSDALLLYTDGFTEASGLGTRRLMGLDDAQRLFRASLREQDAPRGVQNILSAIHTYAGPRLRDDLALLLLRGNAVPRT